ncbi:MAG: GtrA family protein [Actinomycetota bacterium]|nr:GtrA family protein [Actinomycetota bacterium]
MPSTDQRPAVVRAAIGFLDQFRALYREVAKFGLVGLSALVVDIGLFNYLRFAGGQGPMFDRPISAKIVSVAVATMVAYFGNRYWTFRHRGRTHMSRELAMFFLLNGVGMLIAIGCLYLSHYVLGFTSALADNLSANVIGLGLGTMFRFWSYRKWVFPLVPRNPADQEVAERDAATLI